MEGLLWLDQKEARMQCVLRKQILTIEIKKAKPVFDSWMSEQLADCSADEAKIIKETVVSLKKSLRKVYGKSSKYRYD